MGRRRPEATEQPAPPATGALSAPLPPRRGREFGAPGHEAARPADAVRCRGPLRLGGRVSGLVGHARALCKFSRPYRIESGVKLRATLTTSESIMDQGALAVGALGCGRRRPCRARPAAFLSRISLVYRHVSAPRLAHFIDSVTVVGRFMGLCSGSIDEMCELWAPDGRSWVTRVANSVGATARASRRAVIGWQGSRCRGTPVRPELTAVVAGCRFARSGPPSRYRRVSVCRGGWPGTCRLIYSTVVPAGLPARQDCTNGSL